MHLTLHCSPGRRKLTWDGPQMSSNQVSNFIKVSPVGVPPGVVSNSYEFGEFRLDVQRRVLRRRLHPVPLTPKACEILSVLVESGGRVVTKDALMKAVWPNSFVDESN